MSFAEHLHNVHAGNERVGDVLERGKKHFDPRAYYELAADRDRKGRFPEARRTIEVDDGGTLLRLKLTENAFHK